MAITSQTREVHQFDGVELRGTGTIHITQGPEPALVIEAEPDTLDKIVTDVEGNTLVIRFKWFDALLAFKGLGPIDIRVTTPNLRALRINGSGTVIGETPLATDRLFIGVSGSGKIAMELVAEELRANISGSGDLKLRGAVKRQEIQISGGGDIEAADLHTEDTDIQIAGSGRARLFATERLDVTISGSGKVEYAGGAAVSQRISGSGSITQLVPGDAPAAPAADQQAAAEEPAATEAAEDASATDSGTGTPDE